MKLAQNNAEHGKLFKNGYIARLAKRRQKRDLSYARLSSFVAGLICGVFGMLLILVVY